MTFLHRFRYYRRIASVFPVVLSILLYSSSLRAADLRAAEPDRSNAERRSGFAEPFVMHNYNPLSLIHGLPSIHTNPLPVNENLRIRLQHVIANQYTVQESGKEKLLLDGEIGVTSLQIRGRLPGSWEAYLFAPYVTHQPGLLDNMIVNWHDWFSLPQGGRTTRANNLINYVYVDGENLQINIDEPQRRWGDIRLGLGYDVSNDEHTLLAQFELKLPTGEPKALTGSGKWDASLSLGSQTNFATELGVVTLLSGAGVTLLGDSDLPQQNRQNNWTATARGGIHWYALENLAVTAQLDFSGALYDSNLKVLGDYTLQFSAGAQYRINESWQGSIAFSEDFNTMVSPDFVLLFALAKGF